MERERADIVAVNENLAGLGFESAVEEAQCCRFAGSCGTDKGDALAGFDGETDIAKEVIRDAIRYSSTLKTSAATLEFWGVSQ